MQAHTPPPGYIVRLEKNSLDDNCYIRKKGRMRKWLCCTCQAEESYPRHESEPFKSPKEQTDGKFLNHQPHVIHLVS